MADAVESTNSHRAQVPEACGSKDSLMTTVIPLHEITHIKCEDSALPIIRDEAKEFDTATRG